MDLIGRQSAIDLVRDVCDAILSQCGSHYDGEDEVYDSILEVNAILKCNKEIRTALASMPSAEPTEASCWGCNCPKMERMLPSAEPEPKWHDCDPADKNTLPEPGSWAIWCDKEGHKIIARWKEDAIDHFYPDQRMFDFNLEDAVAWTEIPKRQVKTDIKNLPSAQPEQRWISCKTALPEKGQYVLCQCRAGIMDVLRLTDDNDWYKDSTHIYMHGFVLAWMPLPEPWEGEQQDG